jgi:hypothetical protein
VKCDCHITIVVLDPECTTFRNGLRDLAAKAYRVRIKEARKPGATPRKFFDLMYYLLGIFSQPSSYLGASQTLQQIYRESLGSVHHVMLGPLSFFACARSKRSLGKSYPAISGASGSKSPTTMSVPSPTFSAGKCRLILRNI